MKVMRRGIEARMSGFEGDQRSIKKSLSCRDLSVFEDEMLRVPIFAFKVCVIRRQVIYSKYMHFL
jgi:hypothetical protein